MELNAPLLSPVCIGLALSYSDEYLLRFILHDWSDSKALAILKSVRRAMKPAARLAVVGQLRYPFQQRRS